MTAALAPALALAAPAGATPRLVAASALDRDGDGSVDTVVARFSGKVAGKPARGGRLPFAVKGYTVTAVARARGKRVRIAVAETGACDAGLRPVVAYRPRGRQRLTAGRRVVGPSRVDMARRDRRPPAITCAVTGDADGNGRIDRVTVTYSRPVRSPARRGKAIPFTVDRHVVERAERSRGREVVLALREKAAPDTGDVPAVIYRAPRKARQGVRPRGRGRAARSATFNGTRDRARPLLLSASTADGDGDGRLDAVVARFSEAVRAPSGAVAVAGASAGASAADGPILVTPISGGLGGGARPATVWGADTPVRDLAGNPAERTERTPDDGAGPVIVAARTADRGGAPGHLDTVEVSFSEPVSLAGAGQPFGVTGYVAVGAAAVGGARVDVALGEAGQPDSGARPAVGYLRGRGAAVRDAAGNEAVGAAFGGTADGVGPRLVAATTVDADLDGRLDAVRYRFSEPVRGPASSACPGCGFSADGLTALSAAAPGGAEVAVAVAAAGHNGGARPIAAYGPALGGALADAAGNPAAAGSVLAGDGAAPIAIDAHTADLDGDPTGLDAVTLTFAEPIAFAGDATAPFSFSASDGYTVVGVDAASGSSVTVRLQPRDEPDTGSAPAISYNGQGGVQLTDANGIPHAVRGYAGLTRDAVPPVFVGARTADRDAVAGNVPGKLDAVDLVYSEDVIGADDPGPFAVDDRTVDSVAFGARSVQVRIDEVAGEGVFDTAERLTVRYVPGATPTVTDVPEGPGDTADAAPGAEVLAADGAGPAIVGAITGDADGAADGRIDRVDVDFSEPVGNPGGETPALTLSDGLVATAVTRIEPSLDRLRIQVAPAELPNGGIRPTVVVADSARLADLSASQNPARETPFSDPSDGVSPILVGGRAGRQAGGSCGEPAPGLGSDCVRALWSEPVAGPDTVTPFFAASDFTLLGLLAAGDVAGSDIAIAEAARDQASLLSYAAGGPGEATDLAGNVALGVEVQVDATCADNAGSEPNDGQAPDSPLLTEPSLQTLCAGDDDWFRVTATGTPGGLAGSGTISIYVNPVDTLDTVIALVDGAGEVVATSPNPPGLGLSDTISATGLTPGATYWLHVTGAAPVDEGDYCVDPSFAPGTGCEDGDTNPT